PPSIAFVSWPSLPTRARCSPGSASPPSSSSCASSWCRSTAPSSGAKARPRPTRPPRRPNPRRRSEGRRLTARTQRARLGAETEAGADTRAAMLPGGGLVAAGVPARVAGGLLAGEAALFARRGERHVVAVDAEHAAPVHRALEPAQRAVDGLFIANFDTDGQGRPPDGETGGVGRGAASAAPKATARRRAPSSEERSEGQ